MKVLARADRDWCGPVEIGGAAQEGRRRFAA
jgi:hypothetical protein